MKKGQRDLGTQWMNSKYYDADDTAVTFNDDDNDGAYYERTCGRH